jgi:4-amino-4-deoxychorismate lyase
MVADRLPISDRGLQFGDGVFETMLCLDGVPLRLDGHWARLQDGCTRLGIPVPAAARSHLLAAVGALGERRLVAKLVVTRGCTERGYKFPPDLVPNWVLTISKAPALPPELRAHGVAVRMCSTRLAREDAQLVGLKHLNRLTQILARREWNDEFHEGLLLDTDGNLAEGCGSNVFLVLGGRLVTPSMEHGGVHGIMRRSVLEAARALRLPVDARPVLPAELRAADEVFLTNAVQGVLPVRSIDTMIYAAAGPVTRRLSGHLNDLPVSTAPAGAIGNAP